MMGVVVERTMATMANRGGHGRGLHTRYPLWRNCQKWPQHAVAVDVQPTARLCAGPQLLLLLLLLPPRLRVNYPHD